MYALVEIVCLRNSVGQFWKKANAYGHNQGHKTRQPIKNKPVAILSFAISGSENVLNQTDSMMQYFMAQIPGMGEWLLAPQSVPSDLWSLNLVYIKLILFTVAGNTAILKEKCEKFLPFCCKLTVKRVRWHQKIAIFGSLLFHYPTNEFYEFYRKHCCEDSSKALLTWLRFIDLMIMRCNFVESSNYALINLTITFNSHGFASSQVKISCPISSST